MCYGWGGAFSSVLDYFILLEANHYQYKKPSEDWRSNDRQRNPSDLISEK